MQCPFCGQDNDKVVDSRAADGGRSVRRRRQCLACNRRYTTYERPEQESRLTVTKKDGSRQPYDRQKIIDGLQKACYKRPVSDEQIGKILEGAEEETFRNFDKEVPSSFIGDVVARRLRELDQIAYVRFASVYMNFADLEELIRQAVDVQSTPAKPAGQKELFE